MEKHFDINESGCSIRCRLFANDPRHIERAVIFGHGFGGHKDNKAAEKFALRLLAKNKGFAVISFDWPCHGTDGRKKLRLEDCDLYLRLVTKYIRSQFGTDELYAYATSFGAYLVLKYIAEHGNPFRRVALRCPSIHMYELIQRLMTPDDLKKLSSGKPVLVGFDRKIKVDPEFMQELKDADISKIDFLEESEPILILQGTKDEVVPCESVTEFAENNLIEMISVEKADHRFTDPHLMDTAIHEIICWFMPEA